MLFKIETYSSLQRMDALSLRLFLRRFLPVSLQKAIRILKSARRRARYFRQLGKINTANLNKSQFLAHMLVVKKKDYVKVSQVCVLSFLKYHPNTKIVIHCDLITFPRLKSIFKTEILNAEVELRCDMNSELSWQELKIKIICGLTLTESFDMDADLRWNGPLFLGASPTFFVKEFKIHDNLDFQTAFRLLGQEWINECSMKNTSFFSWGHLVQNYAIQKKLWDNYANLTKSIEDSSLQGLVREQLVRLSEQIAFSITLRETEHNVQYLKSSDEQMDGTFVESSYYGATGTSF